MTQLTALNAASKAEFTTELADIFESSPWIPEAVAAQRPFGSLAALRDALVQVVRTAGAERQTALVRAHPELAVKAATLSANSAAEQQGAGLDRLPQAEHEAFARLNQAYRARFGFPFVICVRRHTRDSIFANLERRSQNDAATELAAALDEIAHIAALRLNDRVRGAERLPLDGHLSTHILDTHAGQPAAGVAVELVELRRDGPRIVASAVTNRDGRTPQPLIADRPIPIGRYELRFAIGAYFAKREAKRADPPFLDVVPVQFAVAEAEGRYHIPLLATPWSYTTYRGS